MFCQCFKSKQINFKLLICTKHVKQQRINRQILALWFWLLIYTQIFFPVLYEYFISLFCWVYCVFSVLYTIPRTKSQSNTVYTLWEAEFPRCLSHRRSRMISFCGFSKQSFPLCSSRCVHCITLAFCSWYSIQHRAHTIGSAKLGNEIFIQ